MIFSKIRLAVRLRFRIKFPQFLLAQVRHCDKLVKVFYQTGFVNGGKGGKGKHIQLFFRNTGRFKGAPVKSGALPSEMKQCPELLILQLLHFLFRQTGVFHKCKQIFQCFQIVHFGRSFLSRFQSKSVILVIIFPVIIPGFTGGQVHDNAPLCGFKLSEIVFTYAVQSISNIFHSHFRSFL